MTDQPTLLDVLARRDARAQRQRELLDERHMPLVSLTLVVPGPDKNLPWVPEVFAAASREVTAAIAVTQQWPIWVSETYDGITGPELLLAVDADPVDLKRAMVALETSDPWGRLWDIDVVVEPELVEHLGLGKDSSPLVMTRAMVGAAPRKCLVCEHPSPECARSRRHSIQQLLAVAEQIVAGHIGRIAEAAHQAVLTEARLTPKPGLVDAHDAGAHDDMTLTTFEKSAAALHQYWAACARAGAGGAAMSELREIGMAAELDMLAATHGVNTHKGAIFALGLLCAAAGKHPAADLEMWGQQVSTWTSGDLMVWASSLDDRAKTSETSALRRELTHGEQAYIALGLTGARGIAASGYEVIRRVVLPALRARYEQFHDRDDALRWTLVTIMAGVPDTNVFSRGGADAVAAVQTGARELLAQQPNAEALKAAMAEANQVFTARRWSPGGAADLLAVTVFLDILVP